MITIELESFDLMAAERTVIIACLNQFRNRDLGEIAKELNIGRTTLYEKINRWPKAERLEYKKWEKRRVGRKSSCPHAKKQYAKRRTEKQLLKSSSISTYKEKRIRESSSITQKEREFQKKNKEYLKKKNALMKEMRDAGRVGNIAMERRVQVHMPVQLWTGD